MTILKGLAGLADALTAHEPPKAPTKVEVNMTPAGNIRRNEEGRAIISFMKTLEEFREYAYNRFKSVADLIGVDEVRAAIRRRGVTNFYQMSTEGILRGLEELDQIVDEVVDGLASIEVKERRRSPAPMPPGFKPKEQRRKEAIAKWLPGADETLIGLIVLEINEQDLQLAREKRALLGYDEEDESEYAPMIHREFKGRTQVGGHTAHHEPGMSMPQAIMNHFEEGKQISREEVHEWLGAHGWAKPDSNMACMSRLKSAGFVGSYGVRKGFIFLKPLPDDCPRPCSDKWLKAHRVLE